ncbi:MAG: site-specific integrase [Verrucomicrobiia bacterium]
MRFPVTIRHRTSKAKIYAPAGKFNYYRVAFTVAGKRRMQTFANYPDAKAAAERIVRDTASGSQAAALTARQSRDALAALQCLESFRQSTGRRVSLLEGISKFVGAVSKLNGRDLDEAITGYMRTVANVKRKDIKEAVAEFLQADAPRTKAAEGQRSQLSAKYAYNRQLQLDRFAATFPNTAVCDLSKEHLDTFIGSLDKVKTTSRNGRAAGSAKSRNHYRATVRQFLQWAVRKDYLAPTHRLIEADAMRPERANTAAVELYTPDELAALLSDVKDDLRPLRPIIAIGGLAGLRTAELLRLDWADVWRVADHIEVTAGKAKTRQRRLVEICPALAAWLEPFRKLAKGKLWTGHEITFQQHFVELCEAAAVKRKTNGLRHAFCTYHFAAHANENQTAQQAGNSPAMIHAHYKGLATKADAEKWFKVLPPKSAKNVIALPAVKIT